MKQINVLQISILKLLICLDKIDAIKKDEKNEASMLTNGKISCPLKYANEINAKTKGINIANNFILEKKKKYEFLSKKIKRIKRIGLKLTPCKLNDVLKTNKKIKR